LLKLHSQPLRGRPILWLVVAAALPASAAEPERVEARFEIFGFAGLHVLTNRTTVQERGDRYAIATDLETRGLASVFVDLTSHIRCTMSGLRLPRRKCATTF